MSLVLPSSFYQAATALLTQLGVKPTATNINLLAAWSYCEKPHTGSAAWQWNNPWNTTQSGFGESQTANSTGVGIYPTQNFGIQANATTLQNGLYPHLLQAIQTSNASLFFSSTHEMATWGTNLSCIHSDYNAMGSPPAQYLTAASTAPGPGVVITPFAQYPRISLGIVAALGIGVVAVVEGADHWPRLRSWLQSPAENGKPRSSIGRAVH